MLSTGEFIKDGEGISEFNGYLGFSAIRLMPTNDPSDATFKQSVEVRAARAGWEGAIRNRGGQMPCLTKSRLVRYNKLRGSAPSLSNRGSLGQLSYLI